MALICNHDYARIRIIRRSVCFAIICLACCFLSDACLALCLRILLVVLKFFFDKWRLLFSVKYLASDNRIIFSLNQITFRKGRNQASLKVVVSISDLFVETLSILYLISVFFLSFCLLNVIYKKNFYNNIIWYNTLFLELDHVVAMPTKGKKGSNTYRFQSFSEQIGNINIDVHRNNRITSKEVPDDDKDTFFRESLEKWAEINCSLDFTEFYRKVNPLVKSFNQLVYHKDRVIEIIKEYLTKKESLAHEACLELLAQLSKDLLDDFYAYFDELFPLLVKFLVTQDSKLIENTFICFAYIFKFLWRWMLKDLKNFFK